RLKITKSTNLPKEIERVRSARDKLAILVISDPVYLPIFERLESDLAILETKEETIERAKNIARQRLSK
ncbi:MAG: hypothetical protein L3J15_08510, partial [Devosiaceae bacterium]|nr:hypothetical protein [Devosiaceae bacterium]